MELHNYIAKKLEIKKGKQIECIKNILENTVVLNLYRNKEMSEKKIKMLVKLTGSYLSEVLEVINDPNEYEKKMQMIKEQLRRLK